MARCSPPVRRNGCASAGAGPRFPSSWSPAPRGTRCIGNRIPFDGPWAVMGHPPWKTVAVPDTISIETPSREAVMAVAVRTPRGPVMRVRPVREWFGLSLDAFARALGVSRATVARWEAANSGPARDTAAGRALASMVEIRRLAQELFGRDAQTWFDSLIPMLRDTPRSALVKHGPFPVRQVLWEARHSTY